MNIKIIGSGAIGSLCACLFNAKRFDVCFANNPRWEQKRISGTVRLVLPESWLIAEGICYDDDRKAETVFVCVKRNELPLLNKETIMHNLADTAGDIVFFNISKADTAFLNLDNGNVKYCLTLLSSVCLQPGDVELSPGESYIMIEKDKNLKKLFASLRDFGIKLHVVDDLTSYMNSFFIYQLLFLPVAMCNTTLLHFLSYREGRELAIRVLQEGIKTFEKSGKPMGKLPACDPLVLLANLEKKPDQYHAYRYKPDRSFNPLLKSLLLNKEAEEKELNGALIALAKEAGVDSSWNWRLVQKLSRIKRYGFYPNPPELLKGI